MKSYEVISALGQLIDDKDIIVSSNGNISREAFHLLPRPQVYLRGSMGLPIAVGLGIALSEPRNRVIVLIGDGNLLMGLGTLATAAFYRPDNLKILILDNGLYFTTGGQKTVSTAIDFNAFLQSFRIPACWSKTAMPDQISVDLSVLIEAPSMGTLHLNIKPGKKALQNISWPPSDISKHFSNRIKLDM